MTIEHKISEHFAYVTKAFFETENHTVFLRVEVEWREINKIVEATKEISKFIDDNDQTEDTYILDVYSPGAEKIIAIDSLHEYMDKFINVKLLSPIKDKDSFEGQLISFVDDELVVKWNNKGQFRKQVIKISQILEVKSIAKIVKKEKYGV